MKPQFFDILNIQSYFLGICLMWALINTTRFAAERSWVRDQDGSEVWLVAVRGTFSIFPDRRLEIADEQPPVLLAPEFMGDPNLSSLLYESDLICTKKTTDVILHGHAYTPRDEYCETIDVSMRVGPIHKILRVIGDRRWERSLFGISLTRALPFKKMPIIYERAFGGIDQNSSNPKNHGWEKGNPIGVGFAVSKKYLIDKPAANIENPSTLIKHWNNRPNPSGFGPIPRHWWPRVPLAGTYDDHWENKRQPLLPIDFDEHFFQCAPKDQQADKYLRGGELVELTNLTPGGGIFKFQLPRVVLGFRTDFGAEVIDHRSKLHSVILEPDYPRVSLVWHSRVPCHSKVLKLESTIVIQKRVSGWEYLSK
jgi:hypothetical protein